MTTPFVTVLIPAFNAEKTIKRAMDSVLAQTYGDIEILVVDDGSQDRTSELVSGYGNEKVRLLCLACNSGTSIATNKGVAEARGQLIAFLDADDEWLPTKLAKQIAVLGSYPDAVMVSCGCQFVDSQGNIVREFGMAPPISIETKCGASFWQRALLRNPASLYVLRRCAVSGPSIRACRLEKIKICGLGWR